MKVVLVVFLILLSFFIIGIYIFIPAKLNVSTIRSVNCSKNAAYRFLLDKSKWREWWPQSALVNTASLPPSYGILPYNHYSYHIKELFMDKVDVLIINDYDTTNAVISIIPLANNSVTLQFKCAVITSINPVKRLAEYRRAVDIKGNTTIVFNALQSFLENPSNVYGFPIKEIISGDSTLITIRHIDTIYPSIDKIYRLIDTLRQYIQSEKAMEINKPMLRITKLNDSQFQTMIAIPTNRKLEGNSTMFFQRFVPYKTLTCMVKGGAHSIEQGFKQMEVFVEDYQRTPMAVPFQSLVTDRRAEPDSTKWITVICQPVS